MRKCLDKLSAVDIMVSYDTTPKGGDYRMCSVAIQNFLNDVRSAIDHNKFYPINRHKNMQTLSSLGISWETAKDEIYTLTAADYYCGPKVDRDYPTSDYFWEFKKKIGNDVIYIKLKVLYQTDDSIRVVSFHFDEK